MASCISVISKRCRELAQLYGFQKEKKCFWRIVNDMYQFYSIDSYSLYPSVRKCRISFGVMPLCSGVRPNFRLPSTGPYYLKRFEAPSDPNDSIDGWEYTSDPVRQQICHSEAARMLTEHLMPFFERTTHSETALEELIQLEALIHDNRLEALGLSGKPELDPAGPNARLNLYDGTKFYLAIKAGNFEFARQVLEKRVCNYSEGYNRRLSEYCKSHKDPPSESGIEHMVEQIQKKDFLSIHSLVRRNDPLAARIEEAYLLSDKKTLDRLSFYLDRTLEHDAEYFRKLFSEKEEMSRKYLSTIRSET